MQVYVFQSQKISGLYAFTKDQSGNNLDAESGPWKFRNALTLTAGENRIGVDSAAAIEEITSKGVHYTKAEIKVSSVATANAPDEAISDQDVDRSEDK